MKTVTRVLAFVALATVLAFGQATTPSTTLSSALTATVQPTTVCLASTTNITYGNGVYGGLYVDLEYMAITSAPANNCVTVARGQQGTIPQAHASGQTVWIDAYQSQGLDSGFRFGGTQPPYGPCTPSTTGSLPRIHVGLQDAYAITDCPSSTEFGTSVWTPYAFERTAFIGPGNCAWSTTGTANGTNGLTIVGASNVPVNQVSVSNAAASANTLNCWISGDTFQPLLNKGVTITSYDVLYGVQTTTLTSINGAAVGTIAFPAPAATETASTVAPVSAGGSLTQTSSSGNMAATTAGAFKTARVSLGTPLNLSTDRQLVMFTLVFNQSASAAQVVNTPGMLVHYTFQER